MVFFPSLVRNEIDTLHIVHANTVKKKIEAKESMKRLRKTVFNNNLSKSGRVRALVSLNELWGHRLALIYHELA